MGCCLFASVLAGAPRLALVLWWLFAPGRVTSPFGGVLVPILGLIFLPWTTLAYVFAYPGGIGLFGWILVALAFLVDIGAYGGGGYSRRRRYA